MKTVNLNFALEKNNSQYDKLDKKYNFTEFLRENPCIEEKDED